MAQLFNKAGYQSLVFYGDMLVFFTLFLKHFRSVTSTFPTKSKHSGETQKQS